MFFDTGKPVTGCSRIMRSSLGQNDFHGALDASGFPTARDIHTFMIDTMEWCDEVLSRATGFLARIVPLTWGQPRYKHIVPGSPTRRQVLHWWRERLKEGGEARVPPLPPDLDTQLPWWASLRIAKDDSFKKEQLRQRFGPLKLIKALKILHTVRDSKLLTTNVEANAWYLAETDNVKDFDVPGPGDAPVVPTRDPKDDPGARVLERARAKLDAVCCLLQRREWQRAMADPADPIASLHIMSDASPVTGNEIQGMCLEIAYRTGLIVKEWLPAMSMHYGFCSAMDKGIALLWSLWLIVGPLERSLQWLLNKIASITTDQGNEIEIGCLPNIVPVFSAGSQAKIYLAWRARCRQIHVSCHAVYVLQAGCTYLAEP